MRRRFSRRHVVAMTASSALAAIFAACGGGKGTTTVSRDTPRPPVAADRDPIQTPSAAPSPQTSPANMPVPYVTVSAPARRPATSGQAAFALDATLPTANGEQAIVIPYPPSRDAKSSLTYSLTANRQPIFVEKYNGVSYARFAFAGTVDIAIAASEAIRTFALSPKSYGIPVNSAGGTLSFSLTVPQKLVLWKVNGLAEKLYIFADPLEDDAPRDDDPGVTNIARLGVDATGGTDVTAQVQRAIDDLPPNGVLHIPAGMYAVRQLVLKSDMTLYLAAGAVLQKSRASKNLDVLFMRNVANVRVGGRGTIDGNGSYLRPRGGWFLLINAIDARNVVVRDILLKDACAANIAVQYGEDWLIDNVKVLEDVAYAENDGVDFISSRRVTVDNVFFSTTDDATSHGGNKEGPIQDNEEIVVRNSAFMCGGAFKIGTTVRQDWVRNVTYENIDLIAVAGVASLWPITGANFEKISFRSIRVEELRAVAPFPYSLINEWRIEPQDWEPNSTADTLGYIRNIRFQNVTLPGYGDRDSVFEGYDATRNIRDVAFENYSINGKLIENIGDARIDANQYVTNVTFTRGDPSVVGIVASNGYTSVDDPQPGSFTVARTGDNTNPVTVRYRVRGTARNGTDYGPITGTVTIPAHAQSAPITVRPMRDRGATGLQTVLISLVHDPGESYLLGPGYQAAVTIVGSAIGPLGQHP